MKQVSIIVPCYKQAEYLDECLTSVVEQTYTNWECVVVDDGSPDNTEQIMSHWLKKDSRFRYLKKENEGLAAARNSGIRISKGAYILPLDADDKISSNYIESCVFKLDESSEIKLVYGKAFKFGAVSEEWNLEKYSFEKLKVNNLIYCTAMFRKSDWTSIGGYDEVGLAGWEDWDFWLSLLKYDHEVAYIDKIYFYYRIKEESMILSLVKNEKLMSEKRDYLFNKHRKLYTDKSNYELYLNSSHNEINKRYNETLNNEKVAFLMKIILRKILRKFKIISLY